MILNKERELRLIKGLVQGHRPINSYYVSHPPHGAKGPAEEGQGPSQGGTGRWAVV